MTLDEYQSAAISTAIFTGNTSHDLAHWALGLPGEAGEVAEKVKKIFRDKNGVISEEAKAEIVKELGDVLWYVALMAHHLEVNLHEVAKINVAKLQSRKDRGTIQSSGDNR